MAIVTSGQLTLVYRDYSGEAQQISFPGAEVTDLNFAAQETLADALETAIGGITIGRQNSKSFGVRERQVPPVSATDPYAQREMKWQCLVQTNLTQKRSTFTIPCPDLTGTHLVDNDDHADFTDADVIAFKAALEAYWQDEETAESVTLLDMILIGRADRSPKLK